MRQVTGLFVLRRGMSSPKVILLVEDDPTTAQLFMHVFSEETPYYVYWATGGRAAWHFTQHVKPQLFLLEYSLPDTNGIQL